jgi:excisionase family DNA binding protein
MAKDFTVATLAEYLGCSRQVIYNEIREGRLTAWKLGGKLLRIRPDEVERYRCRPQEVTPSKNSGENGPSGSQTPPPKADRADLRLERRINQPQK